MNIKGILGRKRLYADGGTGTILQAMGLQGGVLADSWNLLYPERIVSLHRSYIDAGANLITTNTFSANPLRIKEGLGGIVKAALRNADEARKASGREDVFIGLDIGPTGKLLSPLGDLAFEDAVASFAEVIRIAASEGIADYIMIETMADSLECKAAVLAARENCDLPVFVTLIFDGTGRLLTGGTPESVVPMLEGLRVDALGVNCGLGPKELLPVIERICGVTSLPVIANPNAGLPVSENGNTVYRVTPEEFADTMEKVAALPVQVLGGCCGTTPDHIREMIARCANVPLLPPAEHRETVVSSFSRAVRFSGRPVLIGERINPTGKKKLKEALVREDLDYVLSIALKEEEAGADVLDVNAGLPGIDEKAMLQKLIPALQSVTPLPLQIDSSDPAALEAALRIYNGKPMINSVSGKQEVMDAVFPAAAKYGGVIVALPLDEDGIPETAEGRIRIARKILAEAASYGIPEKDIVLDGLAMTISADPAMGTAALNTVSAARHKLGLHTILGVSNVSFGLPLRGTLNAAFLTMAMQAGLSAGIVDPTNEEIRRAYLSWCAISGLDPDCGNYISAFAGANPARFDGGAAPSGAQGTEGSPVPESSHAASDKGSGAGKTSLSPDDAPSALFDAVVRGLESPSSEMARKALENGMDPLALIEESLIPALDLVGKKFEDGSLFLPQLLRSADAAKEAFRVVKEALPQGQSASKGRVILATVKGDIHDIGKNIVKVLLENYSFEVLDLGKDVSPETIVEKALENDIRLVGLSALMTTTVPAMEETIRLLRERKPDTKIVVGGAVLTEDYAARIGADFYAKDGMATVRCAESVFS